MKTTIDLPDELLIEAKKRAAESRTTLREIFERGLRHELADRRSARRARKIQWVTARGGLPEGLDVRDRARMQEWVPAAAMIAIDTNLLIYAHRASLPEHRPAQRAIERASRDPRGWGIALPSVSEFWSVVTHPESRGGPSTAKQANGFLRALIAEAGAMLWTPREGFWERLVELAEQLGIRGPRIFDLQIGLTAFDNGAIEIWTHDSRFAAFPGLRVRDPLRTAQDEA